MQWCYKKRTRAVYVEVGAAAVLITKALPTLPSLPNAYNNLPPLDSTTCLPPVILGALLALESGPYARIHQSTSPSRIGLDDFHQC